MFIWESEDLLLFFFLNTSLINVKYGCRLYLRKKKTIIACQKEIDLQSFSDDTSRRNPQP